MEPERDSLLRKDQPDLVTCQRSAVNCSGTSQHNNSENKRASPLRLSLRLHLSLVAIGFIGLVSGVVYSSSYLIKPVQNACSPPWSPSATTYGLSAVGVGWILGGAMGMCLNMSQLILWAVLGTVMMGIAEGIAGTTVLYCHRMHVAGEVIYVATFVLLCIGMMFCYFATTEIALHLLPERPGLAGGIFSLSTGVGNIVFSQIILVLRRMVNHDRLNESMVFFCLGIIVIIISSPWIRVLSTNSQVQKYQSNKHEQISFLAFVKSGRSVAFAVMCFCAYIPILAIVMHQEPLMIALWNANDPPVSILSAILMSSYMGGRVFSFLASDKVGLKRFWLLSLLFQAILLLCLAVLITVDKQDTWSRYLAIGILAAGTAVGATLKVSAGGLCYELYDHTQQVSALGLLVMCSGMACVAGPLAIEKVTWLLGATSNFCTDQLEFPSLV